MKFETGKKKGTTIFQDGKYAYHMLTFVADSRLDMLISVMLIKKTCTSLVYFKGIFLQVILVHIIVLCY